MPRQAIIDSHIHLWPEETSNEAGHAWMTPGMPLAKPHLLEHYRTVSKQNLANDVDVKGVVYIETDVRYDSPSGDVSGWAKGPLDEISFLRDCIEGKYDERDGRMLLALVPWLPIDQSTSVLEEYLRLAKERAGSETWSRVKAFRFLLQAITDQAEFEKLVFSDYFIANLKLLGKRGFSFDIGVDQHSGGIWQLEAVARAMYMAHQDVPEAEKVTFVVNHLCKPEFDHIFPPNPMDLKGAFDFWCDAVSTMAGCSKTYMKLSGAFSELPASLSSASAAEFAAWIKPWVTHIIQAFGPKRLLFGSDWPVCNVKGPLGESSWMAWKDVVMIALNDEALGLNDDDRQWIWWKTAREAYRLP